jgi:hypothetical protein
MLSPSEVTSVADEVARFIESHGVKFERGNPSQYFVQLGHLSAGFTLPLVPQAQLARVVLLKNLNNLWNILVDDEMDREGGRSQLDASMRALLDYRQGKSGNTQGSSAAQVLEEMLAKLPTDPSRARQREAFLFDLWEVMTGFSYEYCINKALGVANSVEYGKYSTITASIKHFLDLDCLFASEVLEDSVYRQLRVGYEHFGLAIKFASDIGTLKRELVEEDNLNLVRILALESGIPEAARKLRSEAEYEALLPRLEPVCGRVRQLANHHLDSAREALARVPGVDTASVVKTVSGLVESYSKRDPFFRK